MLRTYGVLLGKYDVINKPDVSLRLALSKNTETLRQTKAEKKI